MSKFNIPLMEENISRQDIKAVIDFLQQEPIPKLTNGPKVVEFEQAWNKWLGTKYSLFVNSGSSANVLTMAALKYLYGPGEVIVPPLTWVSDISSVVHAGLSPVFCDINLKNLSFNMSALKAALTPRTKAIFLTHVLGINGLTEELLDLCYTRNIHLIEDVCESHGTTFQKRKVGTFGFASNFSFYFAHHMSTIEGGMVCTDDERFYEVCRCLRSHGMLRESTSQQFKRGILKDNEHLNPDFVFIAPGYNFRSTEINAVIGLSQLPRLDGNNNIRRANFDYFMSNLSPKGYIVNLEMEGQCNYAFIAIMNAPDKARRDTIEGQLKLNGIEFRRGLSGGGNQALQPYIKQIFPDGVISVDSVSEALPVASFIHDYSWYIGNYPSLTIKQINKVLEVLNQNVDI